MLDLLGHLILAILIQLIVARLTRSFGAGALAAIAWSISREITQAEYRWIEHFGSGLRANMPWWGGLDPRVWSKADPWFDFIVPSLAVVMIAVVAGWKRRKPGDHPR